VHCGIYVRHTVNTGNFHSAGTRIAGTIASAAGRTPGSTRGNGAIYQYQSRTLDPGKEEDMNDVRAQQTADGSMAADGAAGLAGPERTTSAFPGGLETGARGWRWLTPLRAGRQMQAGPSSQPTANE